MHLQVFFHSCHSLMRYSVNIKLKKNFPFTFFPNISNFWIIKKHQLNPPVSLHLEYDLGGAEKGFREISVDKKVVYDAMKKDLTTIQELWAKA